MKGKQLRKAVMLGMAMSMALWTTGMAAETQEIGSITGTHNETYSNPITVKNDVATESAIQVSGESVKIHTSESAEGEEANNIILDSQGSGIRTEDGDNTTSVLLESSANNEIKFGNGGNGIFSESGMDIILDADGNNKITTTYMNVGRWRRRY